jgi:hypothetical protein
VSPEGAGLDGFAGFAGFAGAVDGLPGGLLDGTAAGALDGAVAGDRVGDAGALDGADAVTVTVAVAVGEAACWLDDAEPQAATIDVAANAPVSHVTRRALLCVLAATTRPTVPAQPVVVLRVIGARAGRLDVDIGCSFGRRYGR